MNFAVDCERIADCDVVIDDVSARIEHSFVAGQDCGVGNGLFGAVRVEIGDSFGESLQIEHKIRPRYENFVPHG